MKKSAPTGLRIVVASVFLPTLVALAQNPIPPAADQTGEAERVVVTGSNIPTAEEVGPNPVQVVTRDFIEKSGEHTAEQLLRDLPIAGANATPLSNDLIGSTPGATSVSLRDFGESATLVLIDGRRVAPYPIGGGDGTKAFVDLNSIPAAAIESIEILKDGASTTYGADAVAGVINIKFRHDYRGAESSVEYGNTLDKDNGEFSSSVFLERAMPIQMSLVCSAITGAIQFLIATAVIPIVRLSFQSRKLPSFPPSSDRRRRNPAGWDRRYILCFTAVV